MLCVHGRSGPGSRENGHAIAMPHVGGPPFREGHGKVWSTMSWTPCQPQGGAPDKGGVTQDHLLANTSAGEEQGSLPTQPLHASFPKACLLLAGLLCGHTESLQACGPSNFGGVA